VVPVLGIEADGVNDRKGSGYGAKHRSIVAYISTDQFGRQSFAVKSQRAWAT
jgi:hypothetical protein